ncbi:hypothetical protein [Leptolyngbya sp. NIES-2104]|uniref:hypothetical protein n=1 Tax=Leptolyngbya sp. NIES-2104 TaxID=1552121 RepID=UPI0006EC676E|nr:hypothetical protein [Leptolyngbya sp. NIES-2104]GAP99002.1 hypothetical protein NIES2104_55590 [Leptolyngbya sp. NIES-2104]
MTPQLQDAIAIAQSLSDSEKRELLQVLSDLIDDSDPTPEEIAASIQSALHDVRTGQTKPIAQLWESLGGE